MDYDINRDRENYFWAACPYWIQDTFKTNFLESHLYNLIMRQGALTWTSDYIAKQFMVSSKTILRAVERLEEIGVIQKTLIPKGNSKKWVLVALYNQNGKRTPTELATLQKEGFINLQKYSDKKNIKEMDKLFKEWLDEAS